MPEEFLDPTWLRVGNPFLGPKFRFFLLPNDETAHVFGFENLKSDPLKWLETGWTLEFVWIDPSNASGVSLVPWSSMKGPPVVHKMTKNDLRQPLPKVWNAISCFKDLGLSVYCTKKWWTYRKRNRTLSYSKSLSCAKSWVFTANLSKMAPRCLFCLAEGTKTGHAGIVEVPTDMLIASFKKILHLKPSLVVFFRRLFSNT